MAHTEGVGLQQEFGRGCLEVVTWRAAQGPQGYTSSQRSIRHRQMETMESHVVVSALKAATEQRLTSIGETWEARAGCINLKLGRR